MMIYKGLSIIVFTLLTLQLFTFSLIGSEETPNPSLTADTNFGADIPTWLVNDEWTYIGSASGYGENFSFEGDVDNLRFKVTDKTSFSQHGSTYDIYQVTITGYLSGEFSSDELSGDIEGDISGETLYRVYDLAEIYSDFLFDGVIYPFSIPIDLDCEFSITRAFLPPVENYNFIIREDWESTIQSQVYSEGRIFVDQFYDEEYNDIYWSNFTSECTRVKHISVPAGYFKCYALSKSSSDTSYYSEEIGNLVKGEVEFSDEESNFELTLELSSYSRKDQSIIINSQILPSPFVVPGDEIVISGSAVNSQSGNPVTNEEIKISIPSTNDEWNTITNELGEFNKIITAPQIQDNSYCVEELGSDGIYLSCEAGSNTGYKIITLVSVENKVPTKPQTVSSKEYIFVNQSYQYSTISTDLNGDEIYFQFTFDQNKSEWIGPYNSGELVTINHTWDSVGVYNVTVQAKDERGALSEESNIFTVYVADPLIIETGGPYQEEPEVPVVFSGSVSGGFPPYTVTWFFGDGTNSSNISTMHVYNESGIYDATLRIVDNKSNSIEKTTSVSIYYNDSTAPIITINQPINGLYLNGKKMITIPMCIVFGSIDVLVDITDDETSVLNVSITVDGNEQFFDSPPYRVTWDEKTFGRKKISISASNIADLSSYLEIDLWKFF